MNLFSCCAYEDIDVKFGNLDTGDVLQMDFRTKNGGVYLTLSPPQAMALAKGISNALSLITVPDSEKSAYFGDAKIIYEENKTENLSEGISNEEITQAGGVEAGTLPLPGKAA